MLAGDCRTRLDNELLGMAEAPTVLVDIEK